MSNAIKEIFINYEEAHKIRGLITYLNDIDDDNTLIAAMPQCGAALYAALSEEKLNIIKSFKNNNNQAALLIRGLPLDVAVPPTPYQAKLSLQSMPLAVAVNLGLYHLMELNPVTYSGENDGRLFRHVIPSKKAMNEKSSHGSTYTLGMHVDNCHLPLLPEIDRGGLSESPEYLSLFGIRCDLKVFTKVAILDEALTLLDENTIEQLKRPDFILKMPDSFINAKQFELPILVQDKSGVNYCRFDKEYTIAKTEKAQQAFNALGEALLSAKAVNHILLQSGDFLIFKNQRVTHARESFTPRFDGTDRWLLRLFGVSDLTRTIPVDITKPYCIAA